MKEFYDALIRLAMIYGESPETGVSVSRIENKLNTLKDMFEPGLGAVELYLKSNENHFKTNPRDAVFVNMAINLSNSLLEDPQFEEHFSDKKDFVNSVLSRATALLPQEYKKEVKIAKKVFSEFENLDALLGDKE
jgi:hypothetical protein